MPYIKETCTAGKTKEFNYYYSYHVHQKGEKRRKKAEKTCEAQKKVNLRQAVKKLTRILNANFSQDDYYLTLKYKKEERPQTKEELRDHIDKYLRDMRRIYKKVGTVFKYVWVAEVGERGAVHVHIVVSGIDFRLIKNIWEHGFVTCEPMREDGQYRKLAEYFVKYSEKTLSTTGELQGKRYNSSKNLIIPEPEKKKCLKDRYREKIVIPKGYYLDADSVRSGIHEITGWEYFFYTVVKLEEKDGTKKEKGRKNST